MSSELPDAESPKPVLLERAAPAVEAAADPADPDDAPDAAAESPEPSHEVAAASEVHDLGQRLKSELARVIVGQEDVVELLLIALLARGHAFFEGVPGLAKTLLISSLAEATSCSFSRVQFTPDLLPSDITGTEVFQEDPATGKRESRFIRGPIFANLVLADEINRTPPKTQAALLEAMQEQHVTAMGHSFDLPAPFAVFATQNPIEHEGTYPLPEAQLDRFMFQVDVPYPAADQEVDIVERTTAADEVQLTAQVTAEELVRLQAEVRKVPVGRDMVRLAVDLVRSSRPGAEAPDFINRWVSWGAGPRASQFLVLGGKARALLHGRYAVSREDIRAMAKPVLSHRILRNFKAEAEGVTTVQLVEQLWALVDPPAQL